MRALFNSVPLASQPLPEATRTGPLRAWSGQSFKETNMSLIALVVALIIIALLVYGAGFLSPPLDGNIIRLIQAAIIIIGALLLAQKYGAF